MDAPGTPDSYALRRRVLLTGVVCLVLFFTVAWTIAWLQISDAWLVLSLVVLYAGVARPMMRPVREALGLRRRLAYDAYLDQRDDRDRS